MLILLAMVGCAPDPCGEGFARDAAGACLPVAGADGTADEAGRRLPPLDGPRLARRLSLDLRGVLPTAEELDEIAADPAALDALREAWLADPRLEDRLVHLFAETWHTRADLFEIQYFEYDGLRGDSTVEYAFERGVGEEPLRLMARIAVDDRPWTDVVTADHTMLPPILSERWPVEVDAPSGGWQPARYTDGRPAAGVLATNGLWWRYPTSSSNRNRARAAAAARLLVCVDLLDRPVSVDRLGADDVEDAVRTAPECVGCHSSLDPIAATLFGFDPDNPHNGPENHRYHPERERDGPDLLGVSPAWFGAPVDGLAGLGRAIAADPRFPRCTVEQLAASLWGREVHASDAHRIDAVEQAFRADDLRLKAALRALTDGEAYQAGAQPAGGAEATARLLTPDQLAAALAEATGFRWTAGGFALLDDDTHGYRVLLGGVDGIATTRPQPLPGLAMAAVWKRVAEAAADHAVTTELVDGAAGAGLLAGVSLDQSPGEPAFDAALASLRWRLLAERDADADAELAGLWSAVAAAAGPAEAWRAVVAALLRDPHFVTR